MALRPGPMDNTHTRPDTTARWMEWASRVARLLELADLAPAGGRPPNSAPGPDWRLDGDQPSGDAWSLGLLLRLWERVYSPAEAVESLGCRVPVGR